MPTKPSCSPGRAPPTSSATDMERKQIRDSTNRGQSPGSTVLPSLSYDLLSAAHSGSEAKQSLERTTHRSLSWSSELFVVSGRPQPHPTLTVPRLLLTLFFLTNPTTLAATVATQNATGPFCIAATGPWPQYWWAQTYSIVPRV